MHFHVNWEEEDKVRGEAGRKILKSWLSMTIALVVMTTSLMRVLRQGKLDNHFSYVRSLNNTLMGSIIKSVVPLDYISL